MRIKEPVAKLGYVVAVAIGLTLTTIPLAAVNPTSGSRGESWPSWQLSWWRLEPSAAQENPTLLDPGGR